MLQDIIDLIYKLDDIEDIDVINKALAHKQEMLRRQAKVAKDVDEMGEKFIEHYEIKP